MLFYWGKYCIDFDSVIIYKVSVCKYYYTLFSALPPSSCLIVIKTQTLDWGCCMDFVKKVSVYNSLVQNITEKTSVTLTEFVQSKMLFLMTQVLRSWGYGWYLPTPEVSPLTWRLTRILCPTWGRCWTWWKRRTVLSTSGYVTTLVIPKTTRRQTTSCGVCCNPTLGESLCCCDHSQLLYSDLLSICLTFFFFCWTSRATIHHTD